MGPVKDLLILQRLLRFVSTPNAYTTDSGHVRKSNPSHWISCTTVFARAAEAIRYFVRKKLAKLAEITRTKNCQFSGRYVRFATCWLFVDWSNKGTAKCCAWQSADLPLWMRTPSTPERSQERKELSLSTQKPQLSPC